MDQGIILAWVSLAVALVGIPLTYVLARRGRQRPDLRASTDFDVIIKSEDGILDRLHMDFDGDKIRSVSRTRIALWNARGDTVRGSDILPTDRLRLQLDSDDLALHVRIVAMSREQIDPRCEIDPSDTTAAVMSFDFLDASDGFIVELLHKKPVAAELVGTIRGTVVSGEKKADLSPEGLDAVAERWFRRFKTWKSRIMAGYALSIALGSVGLLVYIVLEGWSREPTMVDASEFDLTELEGQRSFARSVSVAENIDAPFMELAAGTLGIVLMALLMVYMVVVRYVKSVIPRSIVLVRHGSNAGNGKE